MSESFTELVDLVSERIGGKTLSCSDDFFAPMQNMLKAEKAIFIHDKYTDKGKWMDGWESRRKRTPGHDWCIVLMGTPGVIKGVNVDTSFFVGNNPEFCSLEASRDEKNWTEILPKSALKGGGDNLFSIPDASVWTHLRLHIYPDGGVARFRVYGEVKPDWEKLKGSGKLVDLAAIENGGVVHSCNDMFFGPKDNLIMPGRAKNMGDGWETRRRRGPGNDWIIVKLGRAGKIKKIEVDTNHFKGNFPDSCSIEAARGKEPFAWTEVLPQTKLQADHQHYFEKEIKNGDKIFDHLRLQIYPDGGISRLRVWGEPE